MNELEISEIGASLTHQLDSAEALIQQSQREMSNIIDVLRADQPDADFLSQLRRIIQHWAVQSGMTVSDALKMPFYHPVIEEALQAALYNVLPQLDVKQELVELQQI